MNLGNKMLLNLGYKQVDRSKYYITMHILEQWEKYNKDGDFVNSITFYEYQKVSTLLSIDSEELKAIKQKFIDFRWC